MDLDGTTDSAYGSGTLERIFGDNSRTRLFRCLYDVRYDGPILQTQLADRIGVEQPTVSRQKRPLLEHGLINDTNGGLEITTSGIEVYESIRDNTATDE